jgi:hypothetical protein
VAWPWEVRAAQSKAIESSTPERTRAWTLAAGCCAGRAGAAALEAVAH